MAILSSLASRVLGHCLIFVVCNLEVEWDCIRSNAHYISCKTHLHIKVLRRSRHFTLLQAVSRSTLRPSTVYRGGYHWYREGSLYQLILLYYICILITLICVYL